eukprot:9298285-Pyramimonas_sp.AAC.2
MDYCFLALEDGHAETAAILVMQGSASSSTGAAQVPAKGPTPYAVAFSAATWTSWATPGLPFKAAASRLSLPLGRR